VHRDRVAVLGGPSFAAEVAAGLPTMVVVAANDAAVATGVQKMLSGSGVRAYVTDDVIGVELGGVLKNVIALAAGVGDGAGLGLNARAGLITRGLAEISRLAIKLGAHPATLSGLAGMGDLVLTCTGGLSRNRRVGIALGEGRKLDEILNEMGMVAEGVKNTLSAHRLAAREGVEMPLVATMHAILYGGLAVSDAVDLLMGRALKAEREW
jgi:glycerol-3-phosphate dehydrogenase (NAD(P)+)